MRRLYQLILKFHAFLIFLVLQLFAVFLLIKGNSHHHSSYLSSSSNLIAKVYSMRTKVVDYFHYGEINQALAEELTDLKNKSMANLEPVGRSEFVEVDDTLYLQKWSYSSAQVVNKSVNRVNNSMTINKGLNHGLREDMGVVFNDKIVGIVKKVSDNFSMILPVINENFKTSVQHKKSSDFGTLESWDGINPDKAFVYGIPSTINIELGDSITTSGLSIYFPEDILVGTVSQIDKTEAADSYILEIDLATNFYSLHFVQVIDNILKIEQLELEQNFENNDS